MTLVDFKEYEQDFKWDDKMHFPIPTLNYILNRMGYDIANGRDEVEAWGYVLSAVREARNFAYAKSNLTNKMRMRVEYAMAHNIDYIYDMLEYVMSFLQLLQTSGDLQKFFEVINSKTFNVPSINFALGNLSFLKNTNLPYNVEYEGF